MIMHYLNYAKRSVMFSNWEIGKEESITEKTHISSGWILVAAGMCAEMLIALPFWHDEFIHFTERAKKYIVKIWKLFYAISLI